MSTGDVVATTSEPTADERAEAAFTAALLADPSDDTARLVFADWLDERGHRHRALYFRQIRRRKFVRRVAVMGGWAMFPPEPMPPPVSWAERSAYLAPAIAVVMPQSDRCRAWVRRVRRGWEIPAHLRGFRSDRLAGMMGVHDHEFDMYIRPLLEARGG